MRREPGWQGWNISMRLCTQAPAQIGHRGWWRGAVKKGGRGQLALPRLSLSLSTSPQPTPLPFFFFRSRSVKAAQRDRAAYLARHDPLDADDPVTAEIACRLATRLDECGGRGPFPRVLILGGGVATGALLARLAGGRGGVEAGDRSSLRRSR